MQTYKCKCGKREVWGSYGPDACDKCYHCNTKPSLGPIPHNDPVPHNWRETSVETDDGNGILTRCSFCGKTKADVLYEERSAFPILGLDFGNVIKAGAATRTEDSQLMPKVKEAIRVLKKEKFDNNVYVISRVPENGDKKVLDFLETENFFSEGLLEREKTFFCLKREEKAPIASRLGITHFVDDRTEVLSHMKDVYHRYAMNPEPDQLAKFPLNDGQRRWPMVQVYSWKDCVNTILRRTCSNWITLHEFR